MIESLAIEGLGAIERAEVSLGPGLTVITGETGAGKTMVLTGLGLLLGGRADAGTVRKGADRARVEGVVRIEDPGVRAGLDADLDEAGVEWDDDSLVVARTVSAEGRGRAHLGGRSVPAGTLARVGSRLVAVHGQDDQHRLLGAPAQRSALDRFAGVEHAVDLAEYAAAFARLGEVEAHLADIVGGAARRQREAADLADLIAAVDDVAPVPGEDESLRGEAARLGEAAELSAAAEEALAALRQGAPVDGAMTGAVDGLAEAVAALDRGAERDPLLAGLRDRLAAARDQAGDALIDLARYRDDLIADAEAGPGRLDAVEERRARLAALRRRIVGHPALAANADAPATDAPAADASWDELLARVAGARERLAGLSDDGALVVRLEAEADEWRTRVRELAGRMSAARRDAADRLAAAVTAELAALAMPQARLLVRVATRPLDTADCWGCDDIAFEFVPRPDASPRPLSKGASGGERSRIMLALEVVFADADPVPTFVFDEVDAGVGGRAAVEVGRRLARLARSAQVLVVTHLPQVAAFADRHIVVRAPRSGGITAADVAEATGEDRARELARMLAGLEESDSARAHAEELLGLAAAEARGGSGR